MAVIDKSDVDVAISGYSIVKYPTHGTFGETVAPNLIYTPDDDYYGTDSFTFTVFDGMDTSAAATVSITVSPPVTGDFSLSVRPSIRSVNQGSSTSYTVTVTPSGGYNSPVSLSVTGLPSGVTATFSPTSLTSGSGT